MWYLLQYFINDLLQNKLDSLNLHENPDGKLKIASDL